VGENLKSDAAILLLEAFVVSFSGGHKPC